MEKVRSFQINDYVKCHDISWFETQLTSGKAYEVIGLSFNSLTGLPVVEIIDDNGVEYEFCESRFTLMARKEGGEKQMGTITFDVLTVFEESGYKLQSYIYCPDHWVEEERKFAHTIYSANVSYVDNWSRPKEGTENYKRRCYTIASLVVQGNELQVSHGQINPIDDDDEILTQGDAYYYYMLYLDKPISYWYIVWSDRNMDNASSIGNQSPMEMVLKSLEDGSPRNVIYSEEITRSMYRKLNNAGFAQGG